MRKELGKWLMDIAKYMVTALLLSSTFGDMTNPLIVACVVVASAATLGAGLWLETQIERRISMGAIVVSAFVTIVAIVGVIYFNYQDKKEQHKANNKV